MREELSKKITEIVKDLLHKEGLSDSVPNFTVVIQEDKSHCDFATNVAMQLARPLRKNPKL